MSDTAKQSADDALTVREAARRRRPLDGTDAQALEGALQSAERELAEAVGLMRRTDAMNRVDAAVWLAAYDARHPVPAATPETHAQCVCPFPRVKCPRCAHPCGACEAASLAVPETPGEGMP